MSFSPDYLLTDAGSSWCLKKFIARLERGSSHSPQCWPPSPFLMSHELPVYLPLPAVSAFSLPEQSQKHMLLQTQVQCATDIQSQIVTRNKVAPPPPPFRSLPLCFFFSSRASKCAKRITGRAVKAEDSDVSFDPFNMVSQTKPGPFEGSTNTQMTL